MENRRAADGRLNPSFESDQGILLEEAHPWKISYLDTGITKHGERHPSKSWTRSCRVVRAQRSF